MLFVETVLKSYALVESPLKALVAKAQNRMGMFATSDKIIDV